LLLSPIVGGLFAHAFFSPLTQRYHRYYTSLAPAEDDHHEGDYPLPTPRPP
jgi:hypothetical protein